MDVVYDIIGIGIGPFNLGLAAIVQERTGLNCMFIDKQKEFNWHAGMMLDRARLQVPYYADLTTLTSPRSRFTYMNYLFEKQKMFAFGIHDHQFILRKEYNDYCRWVVSQLTNCTFDIECSEVRYDGTRDRFELVCGSRILYAKRLVIGVGTEPFMPACAKEKIDPFVFHSSRYLFYKEAVLKNKRIMVIGSGQSAAEILQDLLGHTMMLDELSWYTGSHRIYPMDYSKFATEMSTPAYIRYFLQLTDAKKKEVLKQQDALYRGINQSLINEIYDELHVLRVNGMNCKVQIGAACELLEVAAAGDGLRVSILQKETGNTFARDTDVVILATGYKYQVPDFLDSIHELIRWNDDGSYGVQPNYSIDFRDRIFVQNAEMHTHGFNSADLSLGPYRNAVILNTILGKELFKIEDGTARYQTETSGPFFV